MTRKVEMNPALAMPYGGALTGRFTKHIDAKKQAEAADPLNRQKAARSYKCPTCGVTAGMYCEKIPDVPSRNRQRKARRRHFVHDDRMLKLDLYGVRND